MIEFVARLGCTTLAKFSDLGNATLILAQAIFGRSNVGVNWRLTLNQIHAVGVLSRMERPCLAPEFI